MSQPEATPRPTSPPRPTPRPVPGTTVTLPGGEVGRVVESDEYLDTLQLRGVPISAQVLIEWSRSEGNPVRTWELVSALK